MKSIYEYAKEYTGDPESHERRGAMILDFLIEEGLCPEHRVLNLGCGALSEGAPLITYLDEGNYTGLDPNLWLVRAALDQHPDLLEWKPRFLDRSDFDASENAPYDFIVGHSVLSHVAYWQMELSCARMREVVSGEGAKWLASARLDQYDDFATEWAYPGVNRFRLETVQTIAYNFGWNTAIRWDLKERMVAECPNDLHEWLMFTAVPTPAEMNDRRLQLEADIAEDRLNKETERELRETFGKARLAAMAELPPELQR